MDGDGDTNALTDGFLIVRYLFDFRGDVLIDGAVAPDATRTTAEEIENYIEELFPSLDLLGEVQTGVIESLEGRNQSGELLSSSNNLFPTLTERDSAAVSLQAEDNGGSNADPVLSSQFSSFNLDSDLAGF